MKNFIRKGNFKRLNGDVGNDKYNFNVAANYSFLKHKT